ncbi:MAG: MarR family transcriptional regulator [Streptosporangiales bacterium]|nr:MarR family transcriptional regulator [Streptosporangiales bacterium]
MNDIAEKEAGPAGEVAALELMTRALVGITLHSLEVLGGEVTLPQFRLLLIASGLGPVPSSKIAAAAMMPASSVTRLADKLEAAGLLERGTDPRSRSIVTIRVTGAGLDLVSRVVARRHELLGAVLARMEPGDAEAAARVARQFAGFAGDAAAFSTTGPLPL